MVIRLRTAFFIILGLIFLWFLYIERAILTPFILAAIFAYILNPVVNFLSRQIRLPRGLLIVSIYLIIIFLLGYLGAVVTGRLVSESEELAVASRAFLENIGVQINLLPPFLQETIREPIRSLQTIKITPQSLRPFFFGALSGFVGTIIFLISAFYFLKEGGRMLDRLSLVIPRDYRIEVDILRRKINIALGKYLRGQLLLVFIMATVSFIGLSILGVRFSLLLALLVGFAEIVPMFGPLAAGTVVTFFAIFDGVTRFGFEPIQEGLIVALGYLVINQIENYLIVPNIMGKITKLHPLIVLFAVLAGGHVWGWLGLILAVPTAAVIRVLLEFALDKINERSLEK